MWLLLHLRADLDLGSTKAVSWVKKSPTDWNTFWNGATNQVWHKLFQYLEPGGNNHFIILTIWIADTKLSGYQMVLLIEYFNSNCIILYIRGSPTENNNSFGDSLICISTALLTVVLFYTSHCSDESRWQMWKSFLGFLKEDLYIS